MVDDELDDIPRFTPQSNNKDMPPWALDAFRRIAQALDAQRYENTYQPLHEAPEKTWDGRTVFADGVDWDPGQGRGVYYYDSVPGDWVFMGG